MTSGFLTSDQEPALSLEIRGPGGARSFEAVIDTGFNGDLALPPTWIEEMDLPGFGEEKVALADGQVKSVPMYIGYAILEEEAHEVAVAEAPSPLVGTTLLWGFSLYVKFQPNGAVEIERLPASPS